MINPLPPPVCHHVSPVTHLDRDASRQPTKHPALRFHAVETTHEL